MQEIAALIGQYGFPVVMVVWFAWRLEQRVDQWTATNRMLEQRLDQLTTIMLLMYAEQTGKTRDEAERLVASLERGKR